MLSVFVAGVVITGSATETTHVADVSLLLCGLSLKSMGYALWRGFSAFCLPDFTRGGKCDDVCMLITTGVIGEYGSCFV